MYRVRALQEALQFGFEEYPGKGHYFFVEWPDIIRPLLPGAHTIFIEDKGDHRRICF
jgi:tRNA A37 threonylcarbamoyladenosine biosynthesis protein TsaE